MKNLFSFKLFESKSTTQDGIEEIKSCLSEITDDYKFENIQDIRPLGIAHWHSNLERANITKSNRQYQESMRWIRYQDITYHGYQAVYCLYYPEQDEFRDPTAHIYKLLIKYMKESIKPFINFRQDIMTLRNRLADVGFTSKLQTNPEWRSGSDIDQMGCIEITLRRKRKFDEQWGSGKTFDTTSIDEELDPLMRSYSRPTIPPQKMIHLLCLMQNEGIGFPSNHHSGGYDLAWTLDEKKFPILTGCIDHDGVCNEPTFDLSSGPYKLSPKELSNLEELYNQTNSEYHIDKIIEYESLKDYFYDLLDDGYKIEPKYIWNCKNGNTYLKDELGNEISHSSIPVTELEISFSVRENEKYFKFSDNLQEAYYRIKEQYDVDLRISTNDRLQLSRGHILVFKLFISHR